MDTYIRRKKDMLFRSVKSLKTVEDQIKKIDTMLGVPHKKLNQSSRPEVLAAIFGVGSGLILTSMCLYLGGSVLGLSPAGISSALDEAGALVGGNDTVGIFVIMLPLFVLSWLGFHRASIYRDIRLKESKIFFYKRALAKQAALKNLLFKLRKLDAKYAAEIEKAKAEKEKAEAEAKAKAEAEAETKANAPADVATAATAAATTAAAAAAAVAADTADTAAGKSTDAAQPDMPQDAKSQADQSESAAPASQDNEAAASKTEADNTTVSTEATPVADGAEVTSAAPANADQLAKAETVETAAEQATAKTEQTEQTEQKAEAPAEGQPSADAGTADQLAQADASEATVEDGAAKDNQTTDSTVQTEDGKKALEALESSETKAAVEKLSDESFAAAKADAQVKAETEDHAAAAQENHDRLKYLNDLYHSLQQSIKDIKHDLGIV